LYYKQIIHIALTNDKNLVCMFHELCPELANHSQAYWFHPDQPHSYFPNVMPQFGPPTILATPPYRLCTIGEIVRQNYGMMELFLSNSSRLTLHSQSWVKEKFHHSLASTMCLHINHQHIRI
jgi:hypothetical protein